MEGPDCTQGDRDVAAHFPFPFMSGVQNILGGYFCLLVVFFKGFFRCCLILEWLPVTGSSVEETNTFIFPLLYLRCISRGGSRQTSLLLIFILQSLVQRIPSPAPWTSELFDVLPSELWGKSKNPTNIFLHAKLTKAFLSMELHKPTFWTISKTENYTGKQTDGQLKWEVTSLTSTL